MASAVYPLFGAAGTLVVGWLSDRLEARRGQVVVGSCVLLVPAIYMFSKVPGDQPTAILACLGLVGFLIYGPYALMAGAMAIDLGSKHSASTVAGILDAVGGLGAILAGWTAGIIIHEQGWSGASELVVYVSLATLLVSLGLWTFRPLPHEASS